MLLIKASNEYPVAVAMACVNFNADFAAFESKGSFASEPTAKNLFPLKLIVAPVLFAQSVTSNLSPILAPSTPPPLTNTDVASPTFNTSLSEEKATSIFRSPNNRSFSLKNASFWIVASSAQSNGEVS